jgi:porphobilinogen synthase
MPGRKSSADESSGTSSRPIRLRRLRRTAQLREWVAETDVELRRLVQPIFIRPAGEKPEPIPSMPGINRYPVKGLRALGAQLAGEGVRSVLLFGVGRKKDEEGTDAWAADGVVPAAVQALKSGAPELIVASDVCLCAYTSHGHCGIVRNGSVANAATCDRLARVAVAHARAGVDVVAPSAMMDGQVGAIRSALADAGFDDTAILAYSTKHASAFYGPFRDAEQSAPSFGDRRGYQIDPRNSREALRAMERDVAEGADVLMVKPALTSLDLLVRAREQFSIPLAAYQVSGEYSMLKLAAANGILEERPAVEESLVAIRRAGADLIVTYFAREMARWSTGTR